MFCLALCRRTEKLKVGQLDSFIQGKEGGGFLHREDEALPNEFFRPTSGDVHLPRLSG